MKKKLLIFLLGGKLNPLKSSKLEIKKFEEHNIDVQVHEMVDIINTQLKETFANSIDSEQVKSFSNFNEWEKELLKLEEKYKKDNILIMNEVRIIDWNTFKINYLIKKLKIRTIEFTDLDIPGYKFHDPLKSIFGLLSIKTKKVIVKKIYLFLKKKFFSFLKKIFKFYPDYFLVFGKKSIVEFEEIYKNQKSKLLLGNSFDYNLYLSQKRISFINNIKKDYALFLESPFPFFLGDTVILGEDKKMLGDPLKWEISFDNFCSFLEKKFNLEVYIANHPRVRHESQNPKYYRGRTVLTDPLFKTSKNAKLLINRISTGITYGIIYNVPIMFINSSDLLINRPNLLIRQNFLASQLGKTTINIDNDLNEKIQNDIFEINDKKYNDYKKNFVTTRNDQMLNSNLIQELF